MAYPVVTHGLLCWPFNWCFVVFLSIVVFMSTCITVNCYVFCVSIHIDVYQSIFPLPHLLERTSDCGRTHIPTYTRGRTHTHSMIHLRKPERRRTTCTHAHTRTRTSTQTHALTRTNVCRCSGPGRTCFCLLREQSKIVSEDVPTRLPMPRQRWLQA